MILLLLLLLLHLLLFGSNTYTGEQMDHTGKYLGHSAIIIRKAIGILNTAEISGECFVFFLTCHLLAKRNNLHYLLIIFIRLYNMH